MSGIFVAYLKNSENNFIHYVYGYFLQFHNNSYGGYADCNTYWKHLKINVHDRQ